MTLIAGSIFASSSTTMHAPVKELPVPPYFSGISIPMRPKSKSSAHTTLGGSSLSQLARPAPFSIPISSFWLASISLTLGCSRSREKLHSGNWGVGIARWRPPPQGTPPHTVLEQSLVGSECADRGVLLQTQPTKHSRSEAGHGGTARVVRVRTARELSGRESRWLRGLSRWIVERRIARIGG